MVAIVSQRQPATAASIRSHVDYQPTPGRFTDVNPGSRLAEPSRSTMGDWNGGPYGALNTRVCDAELMDTPAAQAFDSAARRFLEVSVCAAGHYDSPGLGEWSVRDLLGHTSRSLSTVKTYLDVASSDPGAVDLADAVAYYLAIAGALADTAAVAVAWT
jgi:hypothetical protein